MMPGGFELVSEVRLSLGYQITSPPKTSQQPRAECSLLWICLIMYLLKKIELVATFKMRDCI